VATPSLARQGIGDVDEERTTWRSWHAGLCGAGVLTSINSPASRHELIYLLRDSGARVIFVGAAAEWSFLQVVPMYHIAALMPLLKVHLAGAAIHLVPGWDAAGAMQVIEGERVGAMSVVPTMAVQLLSHPDFTAARLTRSGARACTRSCSWTPMRS